MAIKVKYDVDNRTVTWTSDKCETVVVAKIGQMNEQVRDRALFHGVDARCTDAGAMGFDHWDGKDKPKRYATDVEKLARIGRVAEHLNSPTTGWNWDLRPTSDPLAGKGKEELEMLIKLAKDRLAGLGVKD